MGVEELFTPEAHELPQEHTDSPQLPEWEELNLNGERFLAKKGFLFPMEINGKNVVFTINEYHHPETGTKISVYNLGLDRPLNEPAIVRADYGCPCMSAPNAKVPGHDCAAQRQMMYDTIADIEIGATAIVSEYTAAGNGHGAQAVFEQSTRQEIARRQGKPVPTMQEVYSERGYEPFDKRPHDLVGLALADTLGPDRLAIPAMSSLKKINDLAGAGVNIIPGWRVDLHTQNAEDPALQRDNYPISPYPKTRPYLIAGEHTVPLTSQTYGLKFRSEIPLLRRLPN